MRLQSHKKSTPLGRPTNYFLLFLGNNRCLLFREPYETNIICGQNAELLDVETGGNRNDPLSFKRLVNICGGTLFFNIAAKVQKSCSILKLKSVFKYGSYCRK
jgi:hypothetical protein